MRPRQPELRGDRLKIAASRPAPIKDQRVRTFKSRYSLGRLRNLGHSPLNFARVTLIRREITRANHA